MIDPGQMSPFWQGVFFTLSTIIGGISAMFNVLADGPDLTPNQRLSTLLVCALALLGLVLFWPGVRFSIATP